jgi:hypothetical protein
MVGRSGRSGGHTQEACNRTALPDARCVAGLALSAARGEHPTCFEISL